MTGDLDDTAIMPGPAAEAAARAAVDAYNARRPEVAGQVTKRLALAFVPYAVLLVLLLITLFRAIPPGNSDTPAALILVAAGMGGWWLGAQLWTWCREPATWLQQSTRDAMIPQLLGFAGEVRYRHGVAPSFMGLLPAAAVVRHTRVVHDDTIRGMHGDLAFELGEMQFWDKQGKSDTKQFGGVVFHFGLPEPFPGELVITRKTTFWGRILWGAPKDAHLSEAYVEDRWLRDRHDIRTSDRHAARRLIDGPMARVLRWLADSWDDGVTRIAIRGADCFLFVPSDRNFFELPEIGTPLDYAAHAEPMIRELAMLLATARLVRSAIVASQSPPEGEHGG